MSLSLPCWAIVPATGVGARMASDRPKQYLQLGSKTILERTLDNLLDHPLIDGLVLVLSAEDRYWQGLDYQTEKSLLVCEGGRERYHSVDNGLQRLQRQLGDQDALVLIHDSVRPFVQHEDISQLITIACEADDGAILAAPVADTLKMSQSTSTIDHTISRQNLWRAFTPQAFRLSLIRSALQQVQQQSVMITDDASAMELLGYHPRLIDSDPRNIKITHPDDLVLAHLILQQGSNL